MRDYGVEVTSATTTTTVNVEILNERDSRKSFESSELLKFFDDDNQVEHKVIFYQKKKNRLFVFCAFVLCLLNLLLFQFLIHTSPLALPVSIFY
jgi:hypothetical protein